MSPLNFKESIFKNIEFGSLVMNVYQAVSRSFTSLFRFHFDWQQTTMPCPNAPLPLFPTKVLNINLKKSGLLFENNASVNVPDQWPAYEPKEIWIACMGPRDISGHLTSSHNKEALIWDLKLTKWTMKSSESQCCVFYIN